MTYKLDIILSTEEILIKRLDYSFCEIEQLNLDVLAEEELKKFKGFLSDKRRLEYYFTRVLVRSFNLPHKLNYLETGKPTLEKGHISISHSQQTIIVAYSESHHVGVDIEYYKDKIHRIKHKFLAQDEYHLLNTDDLKELTTIWSIKEAVYKLMNVPGLLFNENIIVKSTENQPELEVALNGSSTAYPFEIIFFDKYLITYLFHLEQIK